MSSVRLKRLYADYEMLKSYVGLHSRLELIQAVGDPPERYQLEYQINSLRQRGDELLEVRDHMVEIVLPLGYPRTPPLCRMLTPIFHPNIAPHAICIGDHWSPGEPLPSIVARIGELIAYQSYNVKSPLNGEAARWVSSHETRLPLDSVAMLLEGADSAPVTPPPRVPSSPVPTPETQLREAAGIAKPRIVSCPQCSAKLRITSSNAGKTVACPRCAAKLRLPALPA
jgi:ubiquitin-protein ligase